MKCKGSVPVLFDLNDARDPWLADQLLGSSRCHKILPTTSTVVKAYSRDRSVMKLTVSAAVKLMPRPPARVLSKNTKISDL